MEHAVHKMRLAIASMFERVGGSRADESPVRRVIGTRLLSDPRDLLHQTLLTERRWRENWLNDERRIAWAYRYFRWCGDWPRGTKASVRAHQIRISIL